MAAENQNTVSTEHTPASKLRDTLRDAESRSARVRGKGADVVDLLHMFDEIDQNIAALAAAGADVRAEQARFETVQRKLLGQGPRFVREAGRRLEQERAAAQPGEAQWWWFLDQQLAQQRAGMLRQWIIRASITIAVLLAVWFAYDRLLAPPPETRRASRHSDSGESLVQEGNLPAALAEFEEASALTPEEPDYLVWQGVILSELGESEAAEKVFEQALPLYDTDQDFLTRRVLSYRLAGNLDAADLEVAELIERYPEAGRGYYLRANIAEARGDFGAAIADLEKAVGLAQAAGDTQLEATIRVQLAMVMQAGAAQFPGPEESETESQ